jgi:DinB superfamily
MLTQLIKSRPEPAEFAAYYGKYISLVPDGEILDVLHTQAKDVVSFMRAIPEAQSIILHPPYTWTIKQVINHLTDGERIFAYRALRIARGDAIPLPGFDENEYAKTAIVDRLKLSDVVNEFDTVRHATLTLLRNLPEESWTRTGTANGYPVSVRALAWIMAGHVEHHMAIVRKRLGK